MYCDTATVAYRRPGINPETGRHYAPWSYNKYKDDDTLYELYNHPPHGSEAILLPCGKCLLCTKRHRMHWVLRCMHELHNHDRSCFLTLTCDDAHIDKVFPPLDLPRNSDCDDFDNGYAVAFGNDDAIYAPLPGVVRWHSLRHKPFQDFFKRLRITLFRSGYPGVDNVRYYMCGEYGDKTHRPHYHAIVFGWMPGDLLALLGKPGLFVSPTLSKLWPYGYHTVARVDPECVSYVAGYVDKKLDGARMQWAENNVAPEYVRMSRNPGIGRDYAEQYLDSDIYPMGDDGVLARDYCMVGKMHIKTPRYYDNILQLRDPVKFGKVLAHREQVAVARGVDFDLPAWLNESHRKHAVAAARRRLREPGA